MHLHEDLELFKDVISATSEAQNDRDFRIKLRITSHRISHSPHKNLFYPWYNRLQITLNGL